MTRNHRSPLRRIKRSFRHHRHARSGRVLQPRKWVFVVGCYNSGTTLLVNLLDAHPELTALPREGVELTDRLPRPEEFGYPRLWYRCREQLEISDASSSAGRAARIKRQWSHYVNDDQIIVEKSPANLTRLAFLQAHFQPAYFIYIVRNGYAVAEGIRRKADLAGWGNKEGGQYPIDDCAQQWVEADRALDESADNLQHLLCLNYEDLAADATGVLARVSEFLAIGAFADDLSERSWAVHESNAKIADMNKESLSRLSLTETSTIRDVANKTLEKYGYQNTSID
jgi:hypothetical protein